MQGRQCLFHGALAVSTCPNCSSMLCKECQTGGKCPRCGFVLGGKATKRTGGSGGAGRSSIPEPEERDWSRL